jgi:S1-C subfamily serine protease
VGQLNYQGLRPNDIVTKIDNKQILFAGDIREVVSAIPNSTALFSIQRNNELMQIPVKVGSLKNEEGLEYGVLGNSIWN